MTGDDEIEVERPGEDAHFNNLREEYSAVIEEAQRVVNERIYIENQLNQLKKKVKNLEEELRRLKTPPFIIGYVHDVINNNKVVVRSSNGTIFLVNMSRNLSSKKLSPGTRVALNQETLAVIGTLPSSKDPLVMGAEIVTKPGVTFETIGGLEKQIQEIHEAIELPLENPEIFRTVGVDPPSGVMLVGPPGCGKTMLAKAVANRTNATFIRLVGSELAQKYIGEGGRLVRELFALAREKAPAIVFIDEIDSIGAKRLENATSGDREVHRTLMQLLSELDGFNVLDDVKIIGATNRPDILDEALLRPGRFDRIIEIPLPSPDARESILKIHTSKMNLDPTVKLTAFAKQCEGLSGAELKAIAVESGMIAIRDRRERVVTSDIQQAIKKVRRETGNSDTRPERLYA